MFSVDSPYLSECCHSSFHVLFIRMAILWAKFTTWELTKPETTSEQVGFQSEQGQTFKMTVFRVKRFSRISLFEAVLASCLLQRLVLTSCSVLLLWGGMMCRPCTVGPNDFWWRLPRYVSSLCKHCLMLLDNSDGWSLPQGGYPKVYFMRQIAAVCAWFCASWGSSEKASGEWQGQSRLFLAFFALYSFDWFFLDLYASYWVKW